MNLAQAKAVVEADERIVEVLSGRNQVAWESLFGQAKSIVAADLKHKAKLRKASAPLKSVIVMEDA